MENPQKKPKLEITSIDKPRGTKLSEKPPSPKNPNVKYSNLATNTNVDVKISETTRTISTATVRISNGQLSGIVQLTPTRSLGDWNLKATVSTYGVTTVREVLHHKGRSTDTTSSSDDGGLASRNLGG